MRAVGRDRPHQRPGRARALGLRLSEQEYAELAVAAREAGLTPSGYAAELTLAGTRGEDPPVREPLRVALAEVVALGVDCTRLLRLMSETSSGTLSASGADRQVVTRALAALDLAAAAVARELS